LTEHLDAWTHIFTAAYFSKLQTMASASGPVHGKQLAPENIETPA
jgi:hypothetical protein